MTDRPLVVVAGNPNAGKTTLFNALTGRRAKVGNYPGITVERRQATIDLGRAGHAEGQSPDGSSRAEPTAIDIADLPGTYSLLAHTGEEQIALEAMLGLRDNRSPDAVVLCVDATQLTRGWYLVLQALELGVPLIVALTMVDEARPKAPDPEALSAVTGCKVVATAARYGVGLDRLRQAIDEALAEPASREPIWHWKPSPELAEGIARTREALPSSWPASDAVALWALMSVDSEDQLSGIESVLRDRVSEIAKDPEAAKTIDDEVVNARYGWIDEHIAPLMSAKPDRRLTDRVDAVLLNRVAGFGVFLALMFVVFQALFAWSDPAITLIEDGFAWAGGQLEELLPAGIVRDFLVEGLIAGVGSVVVFLPQILLLFFFIGLMEDTGYLARVAYLMDRIMRSMNLHGRAFIPMLSGFACAVPAIMATRTMERQRDRLLTMMVVPLMTCSARLPVYTLIIAALFPAGHVMGVLPVQGLLMVAMYLFSTITALIAAWALSRLVKPLRGKRLPFVIELPPYRLPRLRDVLRMMWERSRVFLTQAGTVIVVCTAILWFLLSFPRALPDDARVAPDAPNDAVAAAQLSAAEAEEMAERQRESELLRNSYGGRLGRAIEPAISPLGFDWKIGVGIIGAFAAREVFISTMGVVYGAGPDVDESSATLRQRLRSEIDGQAHEAKASTLTPLVGLSLMIFFALACQCMSTVAVVKRETGGYRWPIFMFVYMTALAWVASFIVYQGGRLLGLG